MNQKKLFTTLLMAVLVPNAAATYVHAELTPGQIVNHFNSTFGSGGHFTLDNYGKVTAADADTSGYHDAHKGIAIQGGQPRHPYFYTLCANTIEVIPGIPTGQFPFTYTGKLNYDSATGQTYTNPASRSSTSLSLGAAYLYMLYATNAFTLTNTVDTTYKNHTLASGAMYVLNLNENLLPQGNGVDHFWTFTEYNTEFSSAIAYYRSLLKNINEDLSFWTQKYVVGEDYNGLMGDYCVFVMQVEDIYGNHGGALVSDLYYLANKNLYDIGYGPGNPGPDDPGPGTGTGGGDVPEPATLLLWALGGMGLAGWTRKRRMNNNTIAYA